MANIIISGNKIGGNYSPNEYYDNIIVVSAIPLDNGTTGVSGNIEVNISKNVFNKPAENTIMMFLVDLTVVIESNRFIRGSTVITNYIHCGVVEFNFKGIINNNFFDSTTVDGASNENLINYPPNTCIFNRNINLILTKTIAWNMGSSSPGLSSHIFPMPIGSNSIDSSIIAATFVPEDVANGGYIKRISTTVFLRSDASTLSTGPNVLNIRLANFSDVGNSSSNSINMSNNSNYQSYKNVTTTLTIDSLSNVINNQMNMLTFFHITPITIATAGAQISIGDIIVKYTY